MKTTSVNRVRNYIRRFFKKVEIPAKSGKTVYIRKEHHERIQQIVRVITKDKISIFGYIDNVLADHFEKNKSEMRELYDSQNKPIF